MKAKTTNWLLVLVWMAGILFFSSRQDPIGYLLTIVGIATKSVISPQPSILLNSTAHFTEYTGLMLLILLALHSPKRVSNFSVFQIAFGLALPFALFDEVYQEFWPGRGFAISDLGFDLLGIIAASIFFVFILFRISKTVGSS